jgi:predicted Na+-dependent transporter
VVEISLKPFSFTSEVIVPPIGWQGFEQAAKDNIATAKKANLFVYSLCIRIGLFPLIAFIYCKGIAKEYRVTIGYYVVLLQG